MDKEIKRYADNGDLKSLKYIFVDALDVDPTFGSYEEEYNYCKAVPGLLESHVQLTPFTDRQQQWTQEYWTKLKMDLMKNFSDQRMAHMRQVARVVMAEKVQRIEQERAKSAAAAAHPERPKDAAAVKREAADFRGTGQERQAFPSREEYEKQTQDEIRQNEREYQEALAREEAERIRIQEAQKVHESENTGKPGVNDARLKKAIGTAIALLAAAAIIFMLMTSGGCSPRRESPETCRQSAEGIPHQAAF